MLILQYYRGCLLLSANLLKIYILYEEKAVNFHLYYSSYIVQSSIPASASASLRSTHVPHLPQCISPPL